MCPINWWESCFTAGPLRNSRVPGVVIRTAGTPVRGVGRGVVNTAPSLQPQSPSKHTVSRWLIRPPQPTQRQGRHPVLRPARRHVQRALTNPAVPCGCSLLGACARSARIECPCDAQCCASAFLFEQHLLCMRALEVAWFVAGFARDACATPFGCEKPVGVGVQSC